jgi:hypothetical protein
MTVTHRRRTWTKRMTIGGASLVALLLIGAFALSFVEYGRQSQPIPFGGTMRLLGVTSASNPVLVVGAPIFRLASPAIPVRYRHHFGLQTILTDGNNPTVWLSFEPKFLYDAKRGESVSSRLANTNGIVRVSDERGLRGETRLGSLYKYGAFPDLPIRLNSLPACGRQIQLDLFGQEAGSAPQFLARFHIENPVGTQP